MRQMQDVSLLFRLKVTYAETVRADDPDSDVPIRVRTGKTYVKYFGPYPTAHAARTMRRHPLLGRDRIRVELQVASPSWEPVDAEGEAL